MTLTADNIGKERGRRRVDGMPTEDEREDCGVPGIVRSVHPCTHTSTIVFV
jgi:hypothetical protein